MRKSRLWAAVPWLLLLATACADLPTAPEDVPHGFGASEPQSYDQQTVQGCVIDGLCLLPPISGGAATCDPYLELDWNCDNNNDDDCMTSVPNGGTDTVSIGLAGCIPSPSKPGGGSELLPHPAPPPSDTCNTGDPVVDSDGVQQGFAALWAASSPEDVMEKRHERGGWIVPDGAGGYSIQPFSVFSSNACEIIVDTSTRPGSAIAFVHTHPYESGVTMRVCQGQMVMGRMVYQRYMNEPSDYDGMAARDIGLPGYIIDYDKITKFVHDPSVPWLTRVVNQNARCGY